MFLFIIKSLLKERAYVRYDIINLLLIMITEK